MRQQILSLLLSNQTLQRVIPFSKPHVLPPVLRKLKYNRREVSQHRTSFHRHVSGLKRLEQPALSGCPAVRLPGGLAVSLTFVFPAYFSLQTPPKTRFLRKLGLFQIFPPFINSSLPPFAPPHLFLGSVLILASAPPKPQYLFCPPLVPRFRLSPTNRDRVTSWLDPSSLG